MRYGQQRLCLEAFLGSVGSAASDLAVTGSRLGFSRRICLPDTPTRLHRDFQHPACLPSCVPPSRDTTGTGILTRFPSTTAFALALGTDSLREDYLYPENLGFSANRFFTCFIVTHVSRITCVQSTRPLDLPSTRTQRSPTDNLLLNHPEASAPYLAPLHFRRRTIRPVSYYAFFKRWLLLSQRPGCLDNSTTLTTEYGFGGLSCRSGLFPFRLRTLAPAV